jgi:hypothetical protein
VDDRVRICREACEPSNRGRFLEDQLLSPDDQNMFRGGIFLEERTKTSQRKQNIAPYLVIHSAIGVIHAYSAQIASQRASSESCDQASKDVSGRPPEVPGYQTRQFNARHHEYQAGTV